MIAKWTAALLMGALAWGSCTAQAEQARTPVADKVVAYQGQQGLKVWTLRIGEAAAGEALRLGDRRQLHLRPAGQPVLLLQAQEQQALALGEAERQTPWRCGRRGDVG